MRVVNRTAVTITGAQPFIDWMRDTDADFNQGAITVLRAKAYGSAFLLPEFDLEEDLQEWVEDNVAWLFEFQLSAWTENEASWSTWPTMTSKERTCNAAAPRELQVQDRRRRGDTRAASAAPRRAE